MRIDHHAYQRATQVAGIGLLLQIAIALLLLLFGILSHDAAFIVASAYAFPGILVWLGLIIVFHQHKLERLEALEEDELVQSRAAAESFFERAADETRVAARRLMLMHKWLMPGLSLFIAVLLAGGGLWVIRRVDALSKIDEFKATSERGWAIAICLAIAAFSFIFSRYVAGMAKHHAWQNLRGGAAYMVGNALVTVALAVGVIFRFFDNESIIAAMGYAIPVLMLVLAAEIVLNFILNVYRPRIPGEVPRPAFDSKLLSLLATPDSIVRSLNEAVNYQFGFDVTSSWGYQLLLRSFVSLIALGVLAMVLLSTIAIVEPHQQGVKLRFGEIVEDRVYESGVMWKWPWPIESADVHDVSKVRSLHLTAKVIAQDRLPPEKRILLWDNPDPIATDIPFDPFIVGSPRVSTDQFRVRPARTAAPVAVEAALTGNDDETVTDSKAAEISDFFSLVDAEIVLDYCISSAGDGLLKFLRFSTENIGRRQELTDRERALRTIALSEVSRHLASLSIDEVLAAGRSSLATDLARKVQAAFDRKDTGVQVLAVNLPTLRPSGAAAPAFEEMNVSAQARRERIARSQAGSFKQFTHWLGNATMAEEVLAAIDAYDASRTQKGIADAETIQKRQAVVDLLVKGGGQAANEIALAEMDRWSTLMARHAQADRVLSQLALYRASPDLYRERETMRVYKRLLPRIDKYIIAIDPSRVSAEIDLKKINPFFEFAGASEEESKKR